MSSRRRFLASLLMGIGLAASYGLLAAQGLLFILPRQLGPKTRRLFIGQTSRFAVGAVSTVHDLSGAEILVKRTETGFAAFSSVCPHLGCRVHWQEGERRFFCPCHRGVFDADGVAVAGPPADAAQSLEPVALEIDADSGVVYLRVPDVKRRRA